MTGLTTREATERLSEHGPNRLIPTKRRAFVPRWLWRAITDPMAILLLLAAPTYFLIGDTTDGVIALVALVPVAGVGWLLEARAARMLDSLRSLTSPTVVVWRDGNHQRVGSEHLVPGDLMIVREGDVIAADADVVAGTQLMVDESALTGESQPITKTTGSGEEQILAGTTVVSGRGIARVAVTGMATQYGSIGALLANIEQTFTPLQRAVGRLVRRLSVVAGSFCLLVVGVEVAVRSAPTSPRWSRPMTHSHATGCGSLPSRRGHFGRHRTTEMTTKRASSCWGSLRSATLFAPVSPRLWTSVVPQGFASSC